MFGTVANWIGIKLKQVFAIILTVLTVSIAVVALVIIGALAGVVVAALYMAAAVFMVWLILWAAIQNGVGLVVRLNDGTPFAKAFNNARLQTSASIHTLRPRTI